MNADPDYSAAYVVLETDGGLEGHGLTFTIGRGNELCVAAIRALAPLVAGRTLESFTADMGAFWRHVTGDSQLRWVGPEKGVIHLATAAIVNAVWDLWAKAEGKPLWKLLVGHEPGRARRLHRLPLHHRRDDARGSARDPAPKRADEAGPRGRDAARTATPPTRRPPAGSAIRTRRCAARAARRSRKGWTHFKIKVGAGHRGRHAARRPHPRGDRARPHADDGRQPGLGRGPGDRRTWSVSREFDPWWIEEPTSPDDVLGHARIAEAVAPVGVATGEHCQNRVIFKQLMQADAIRSARSTPAASAASTRSSPCC